MARPRCVKSADVLEKYVQSFIEECEAGRLTPDDWSFCRYTNTSPSTLQRYYRTVDDPKDPFYGYDKALQPLITYREHILLQRLNSGKNPVAYIFQLKQHKNGGYTDSQIATDAKGATITLKVEGIGGTEAFK